MCMYVFSLKPFLAWKIIPAHFRPSGPYTSNFDALPTPLVTVLHVKLVLICNMQRQLVYFFFFFFQNDAC